MAPEKVTEMVLNADLKCSGCYKKVKKVICKIPQIRDQLFDVDKNKVKIIVVCCSPEKIRDKLQSIEIIEKSDKPAKPAAAADKPKQAADKPKQDADKPKEAEKPKPAGDKPKDSGKPKEPEKAKPAAADKPKENEKPKPADKPPKDSAGKPPEAAAKPKPKEGEKPKEVEKPKDPPKEAPKKTDAGPNPDVAKMVYEPVHGYPQMYPQSGYPMLGYGQYYDQGYGGAPYQHGFAMQVAPPPPPTYGGFGYEHGYNGYNTNRNHYMSNDYGGEEDGEGCSIM